MPTKRDIFDAHPIGGVLVIEFMAPYINDTANLDVLEDGLREVLLEHDQRFILLDCKQVDGFVSRFINSVILLTKRARSEGGQVHMCCLKPEVERVLRTMKPDRVFDFYQNREEGIVELEKLRQLFERTPEPLVAIIDPGEATREELADLFSEISILYRMVGGSGITWKFLDARELVLA